MLTVNQPPPTGGVIHYVATNGSDSASGSSSAPWKTIAHAMQSSVVKPGDTVMVRPGTYNDPYGIAMKSGSSAGYITLKSEVPRAALIRTTAFAGVYMSSYNILDGFDIQGPGHGIFNKELHHIVIRNNYVHDCGNSGMGAMHSDFVTIEGNEINKCASQTWDSGISIYEPRNITGDTTTAGYRIIIRNNISHHNFQQGGPYTDGNGIIMDDFHNDQMGGANYPFPSLVEGNVLHNNGGKGIAVHWSDHVTVRNNTSYFNNRDNKNTATYKGELSQWQCRDNLWVNNIAVADRNVNSTNQAISVGGGSSNTTFVNNLTFNGTVGQSSVFIESGSSISAAAANNKFGVNPLFVNAASGDFRVQSSSPAVNAGTSDYGVGSFDLSGAPRVNGIIDIGAYEQ
jgi:serralysin